MGRYKVVLYGVELDRPKQSFERSLDGVKSWIKHTIESLDADQKKGAYCRVFEMQEVKLYDVHPAVTEGKYAVTPYVSEVLVMD